MLITPGMPPHISHRPWLPQRARVRVANALGHWRRWRFFGCRFSPLPPFPVPITPAAGSEGIRGHDKPHPYLLYDQHRRDERRGRGRESKRRHSHSPGSRFWVRQLMVSCNPSACVYIHTYVHVHIRQVLISASDWCKVSLLLLVHISLFLNCTSCTCVQY